jgi:cytosine/adenosine deaminase-related metal-dependent hydrolase
MIRYHARWVLPIDRPPISEGTVVEHGGRILYVGERDGAPPGEDRDLGYAALLPGLVNAHTHLELTVMRGFLEALEFREWITRLTAAKRGVLTPEMMLDAARLGITEGLRAGITTYADTSDSGVALRAMRDLQVRGVMYQEVFGPAPERCDTELAALRAKVDALRSEETELQRVGISPHAPYTVSDALFRAAAAYARREALPMAIHIAESNAESRYVRDANGPFADALRARGIAVASRARSPLALLAGLSVLDARVLLIHAVRVDADDLCAIARAGCGVAHCPTSNAKLGHGIAPVCEMLDLGIPVGLGSDSVASNNRMHVLEEARASSLFQRARTGRHNVIPAPVALELATLGGARALRLDDRIGSLTVGKEADLAAFDLSGTGDVPIYAPEQALVFAHGGRMAKLVTVRGVVRVWDGRVIGEDDELSERVHRVAAALARWNVT